MLFPSVGPAQMSSLAPRVFGLDDDWLPYLNNEGYVVIGNVLPPQTVEKIQTEFAREWNVVSPNFDWTDKATWTSGNSPIMWNKGMAYSSGFGQARFQWLLRTHPAIQEPWRRIHGTDELVVSYDGFSVFFSPTQKPGNWLHVDQHWSEEDLSIQGAYNFIGSTEKSSGFVVVPRSHVAYRPDTKPSSNGFKPIPEDDPHRKDAVKLLVPANSIVLWNSKTIHANIGMTKGTPVRFDRLSSYICYFPKSSRSEKILERRIAGYENGDNCGHFATRHQVKRHPFGTKARYEAKGFIDLVPDLEEGAIPEARRALI